ncbi:START domain-containing protein [Marinobacteraceae bacterium S3BR75-40.1]
MKTFRSIFISFWGCWLLAWSAFAVFAEVTGDDGWTLRKEEDGIRVYTREVPGSEFQAFRGETVLDTRLSTLVAVHTDVAYVKDWLQDCTHSELIGKFDPKGYFAYFRTEAPWPVSDRDYVLRYEFEQDPESLAVELRFRSEVAMRPETDDCVRITELEGFWKMTPREDGAIDVVYQVTRADPAGSLPSWLANAFVVDQPFNTLKRLRRQVREDKYQGRSFEFVVEPALLPPTAAGPPSRTAN